MLGYGIAIGFAIGLIMGAVLVRYGMGLAEKMVYGAKDDRPVLSAYDAPLEQATTADEDADLDGDELE